jgi:predicted MPP superfamily phosphohydrolase
MILGTVLLLVLLSQGFWFLRVWRFAGRIKIASVRHVVRGLWLVATVWALTAFFSSVSFRGSYVNFHNPSLAAVAGLWISSAMFAYLAVMIVRGIAWLWGLGRLALARFAGHADSPAVSAENLDRVNFNRRRFVQTSTAVAAAAPFLAAGYGFSVERFRYEIREVDLAIAGLPASLAGLRIAQLSDLHISSYMSAAGIKRAVDMANELGADLAVVTGDFLTRRGDPLEACIAELARLRARLGVWGCNGNHEIYANAEAAAERLFARHGMALLRQQSVELVHNAQPFNLIGVDYQRQLVGRPRGPVKLDVIQPLVRRDVPNILLSHNPNTFPSAAELGIELMLTGHTHGGQVRVEILDHHFSPAEFLTPYVAGMYARPARASASLRDAEAWGAAPKAPASVVYVNRGLGTIGAPVRLGVRPEISLHTLRRA